MQFILQTFKCKFIAQSFIWYSDLRKQIRKFVLFRGQNSIYSHNWCGGYEQK